MNAVQALMENMTDTSISQKHVAITEEGKKLFSSLFESLANLEGVGEGLAAELTTDEMIEGFSELDLLEELSELLEILDVIQDDLLEIGDFIEKQAMILEAFLGHLENDDDLIKHSDNGLFDANIMESMEVSLKNFSNVKEGLGKLQNTLETLSQKVQAVSQKLNEMPQFMEKHADKLEKITQNGKEVVKKIETLPHVDKLLENKSNQEIFNNNKLASLSDKTSDYTKSNKEHVKNSEKESLFGKESQVDNVSRDEVMQKIKDFDFLKQKIVELKEKVSALKQEVSGFKNETQSKSTLTNKESFVEKTNFVNLQSIIKKEKNSEDSSLIQRENIVDNFSKSLAESSKKTVNTNSTLNNTNNQNIMDQLVQKLKVIHFPEKTEMQVQLEPKDLGKITVLLTSEESVIKAEITTENIRVKWALEANISQVKNQLEHQNIEVSKIDVSVNENSSDNEQGSDLNSSSKDKSFYDPVNNDKENDELTTDRKVNIGNETSGQVNYLA